MKCLNCRSCTRLVRFELDGQTYINWYCDVCDTAFTMIGSHIIEDKNSDVFKVTKQTYLEKYGKHL